MPLDSLRLWLVAIGGILVIAFRGTLVSADAGAELLTPWLWPVLAAIGAVACFANAFVPHSRLLVLASGLGFQAFIFGRLVATKYNDAQGILTPGRAMVVLPELAGLALMHAFIWRWGLWPHTGRRTAKGHRDS